MEGKGKSINTSVPSIRFKANAEEVEELYQSEEDVPEESRGKQASNAGEGESSPFRSYLPKLKKRSTSIDNSLAQDASPPSDPWKFFSEIKGKIAKSVEERITEIKQRNQDNEESPQKLKTKESKDSDSDISESSISKTCGVTSTTEGIEMSSDEESFLLTKTKDLTHSTPKESKLRKKFAIWRRGRAREVHVGAKTLSDLYELNTGVQVLGEHTAHAPDGANDVESGVEAMENANSPQHTVHAHTATAQPSTTDDVLRELAAQVENMHVDDSGINLNIVSGREIERSTLNAHDTVRTYLFPEGFVDLRAHRERIPWFHSTKLFSQLLIVLVALLIACCTSFSGFLFGCVCTYVLMSVYCTYNNADFAGYAQSSANILEIPAVKEYQPTTKFEGWLNEYPSVYNPQTYHITHTQTVYVRLQGSLLRLSHTKSKISKRAMWNESKHKPSFTHQRIYNVLGAKISLLPENLSKKRLWSKKYPICITLNNDQLNFEEAIKRAKIDQNSDGGEKRSSVDSKSSLDQKQIFSKLTEEDGTELESECSRASSPSPELSESSEEGMQNLLESLKKETVQEDSDWVVPDSMDFTETNIYLFGRTDREKEDWYRRLVAATHESATDVPPDEVKYLKYMGKFPKATKEEPNPRHPATSVDVLWVNSLLGRVLFDCMEDVTFADKLRDRIQRKLSTIRLPYFIEQLIVAELTLGANSPLIHRAGVPNVDQRGLWIDFDMSYEGVIVLTLQTKLNLMKLKQQQQQHGIEIIGFEKMAAADKWQNSDVEDSAESSSDEESVFVPAMGKAMEEQSTAATRNTSKKFIKMVDRIAESKFFQAATDNRYIKKKMEEISNTDLALKVEIKGLTGTLVLNIPPPPTDRVWLGFKPTPKLTISAHPIVGERNISSLKQLTNWIERKLHHEFQKLMVIPNMEDIIIPVMSQKLPK